MLTNATVKAARPAARATKIWDEGGLFLHISPGGTKAWRCRFRSAGKEATISLGQWPEISLAEARDARDRERDRFRGIDPAGAAAIELDQVITFRAFARTWLDRQRPHWSAKHADDVESYLVRHTFPAIGDKPLAAVTAADIIALLLAVEDGGARQLARRLRQWVAKILQRAIAEDLISSNPAAAAGVVLAPAPEAEPKIAVLELADARAVMATIAATPATPAELLASQLLALTAVRSGAIRGAKWEEFDGVDWDSTGNNSAATWTIPPGRMKLSVERKGNPKYAHIVPLSLQAVAVLRAARVLAGTSPFVFGGARGRAAGLSINALSALYLRAGLQGRHCPHGWRATFSTIMNDRRPADRQAIDEALAHLKKDKVEASYNRSNNLLLRREIFQAWADALTGSIEA